MQIVESAKLTGTPGDSGWSQVHDFLPDDPQKLAIRGRLFAVIATNRTEGSGASLDSISTGRELVARLHEEYFGNLTTKPFNALKSSIEKVSAEFSESWGNVEIIASALVGNVVYSAAYGGGKILISRNGSVGTILTSSQETVSASGYPQNGDVMLMATKAFFENVTQGVVQAAFSNKNPEDIVEAIAPSVRGSDALGNLGVAIIQFGSKKLFSTYPKDVKNDTVEPHSPNKDIKNKFLEYATKFADRFPKKKLYVNTPFEEEAISQSKKTTLLVAVALLAILAISIVFGIHQKSVSDLKNKYKGLLTAANSDVDQAISLASVSPDKSRELFYDAEQELKSIESLNIKDSKYDALRQRIDSSRAAILGEYLASPSLFLDMSLLSSGFKGDEVTASGGSLYILDKSGDRLVSVAFDTKKSLVVAGPSQINQPVDATSYENTAFVLMSDGIYEVGNSKSKVIDKTWSGDSFIKAFAGNLYVLDKSGNQIYRYQGNGNTFGDKKTWLSTDTNVSFASALSWAIDGSVYVLYPNSKVLKFSLGSPQNFTVSGVTPEIGSIDAIYADADDNDIYLLDKAGKRVVVVDKSGKYIAQYINDQISQATGLAVSESAKKIVLLLGDKLYSIDIKHLQ